MRKCLHCDTPLTDFDLLFNNRLFPNQSVMLCQCFKCRTSTAYDNKMYKAFKKQDTKNDCIKWQIWGILATVISWIAMLVTTVPTMLPGLFMDIIDISLLFQILPMLQVVWWIPKAFELFCGFKVVKHFFADKNTQSEHIGSHHEGTVTIDTSRDVVNVDIKKVDDYAGGDQRPWILMIILILLFSIWNIPYLIVVLFSSKKKLKNKYPDEVVDAWEYARNRSKRIVIPESCERQYNKSEIEYRKKAQEISNKYDIMGRDVVRDRLNNTRGACSNFEMDGKKYILVGYYRDEYRNNPTKHFLLSKSSNGSIVGDIIIDGYKVQCNENEWQEAWNEAWKDTHLFENDILPKLHTYETLL